MELVPITIQDEMGEYKVYSKSDVDKLIADKDKAFEYAQAVILVDIGIIKNLRVQLWLIRGERAREAALNYHLLEDHPNKDIAVTYKRKAERWEKVKAKCFAMVEKLKKGVNINMENTNKESTIEIRHNGACVKITCKQGRCYYNTSGQPTKELIKVIQYLEQVRAPMATASKMVISEMLK